VRALAAPERARTPATVPGAGRAPRLTLVVPTLDEAAGIERFLAELLPVAARLAAEVIVVDDGSADGTADLARRALPAEGPHRVVVRRGPPSLSLAVIEGWRRAAGPVVGVMDADLSHPPALLPRLLAEVEGGADMALATRYAPGGGVEGWGLLRRVASRAASGAARTLVSARDPLSGFFLVRGAALEGVELDPRGWKIALEVLWRAEPRLAEVPFTFRDRVRGRSKFGLRAVLDYLVHLGRLQRDRVAGRQLRRRGRGSPPPTARLVGWTP